jgi:head-tail adaptor
MKAPHLNRELTLETLQAVPDGAGGYVPTWVEAGRLWAELRAPRGREGEEGEAVVAEVGWRIVTRGAAPGAPSRPVAGQRFRDGSRVFPIVAVHEGDAAGRFLVCVIEREEQA